MIIRKLPNRCYFPVFLMMIGSLGLETNGQVPVRSNETPLPANQVPFKLDNRAFGQPKSNVNPTVPVIRTVPIVKTTQEKDPSAAKENKQVPIIGVDSFSRFPKSEIKPGGTLDFASQVPVVPLGSDKKESRPSIPNFKGPIDVKVIPMAKASTEKPPIVKTNSLPPIIPGDAATGKQSDVKPVIFVSREDNSHNEGNSIPSLSPQRFANPTKPLPKIIRTGQGVEPLSHEPPTFKTIPNRTGSVLVTQQPEPFQNARPLPPINSFGVTNEKPDVVVVENETVPVIKPDEIVNDYFKVKNEQTKNPAALPPIVTSESSVAKTPIILPKATQPQIQREIPKSVEPVESKTLPPVVANLPSETIPVMPLKQVVPETVSNEIDVKPNSRDVGTMSIPVKPMKNLSIANPFIKPTGSKQPAVTPKAASKVTRVAKQQSVFPESSINPNEMLQGITSTMGPVATGSGAFPRSPLAVARFEALYMNRENGGVAFSDSFALDPFDFELGYRLHLERIFGVEGIGITYSGIQEWNDVVRFVPSGTASIIPNTAAVPIAFAPFRGANFQQQYHHANMHNLEMNKVTWGWDVLNLFWGFRYAHYQEEFDFYSRRPDNQQGLLLMDFQNHIFGPQVGGEVFYDIGRLLSTGVKLKVGGTINVLDRDTSVIANGDTRIIADDSETDFNLAIEMAAFGRLRVGPNAHLRAGYEFWYNSKVFSVRDNIPGTIDSTFGNFSVNDELFIHGLTVGFEILR